MNATYVFGPTATPASLPPFIAYPCAGYFPRSLLNPLWSFAIPGANFSAAQVVVRTEAGDTLSTTPIPYAPGFGDNTITWYMPYPFGFTFTNDQDVIFQVTVSGITNAPQSSYTYKVVAIKETNAATSFSKTDPTCIDNSAVAVKYSPGLKNVQWSTGQMTDVVTGLGIGTYTVTITDHYDCETTASVTLTDNSAARIAPGDAVQNAPVKNCDGSITLNLSTTGIKNMQSDQAVGWWITQGKPASNGVTNQPTLDDALAKALVNPAQVTPADSSFIYPATTGTTLTKTFACGANLDPAKTYYATPVLSLKDAPPPTSYSNNTTAGNITINDFDGTNPGITTIPVAVYQLPITAKLKQVCVQISYIGFSTLNDLSLQLVNPSGASIYLSNYFPGNGYNIFEVCYVDDGTGANINSACLPACYTGLVNSVSSFTPLNLNGPVGSWKLLVDDHHNKGSKPYFISVSLVFDQPSFANVFPKIDFTKCILGTPVEFTCASVPFTPPTLSGQVQFCQNAAGQLDAGSGYTSYHWSTGQSTRAITPPDNGNFTVTVTNAQGCTGTASVQVALVPPPVVSLGGPYKYCAGNPTALNAGSGFTSYQWSNGQSAATISPQQSGLYTVTVSNGPGCTASASAQVNVIPKPPVDISGQLVFCEGNSSQLSATSGYAGYQWNTGLSSQSITTQQSGNYTVTVADANGCTNTSTVAVLVNPTPAVHINGITGICEGSPASLDAGPGFAAYHWSDGSTAQVLQASQGGNYSVTVTDDHGCSNHADALVTVHPNPVVNLGPLTYCEGNPAALNAGTGFVAYHWSSGQTAATIIPLQSGTYIVTVTDANGCTGSASAQVNIDPKPLVSISGQLSYCEGAQAPLNATAGYQGYHWSNGADMPAISPQQSGTYTVTVTDINGCTNTTSVTVNVFPRPDVHITGLLSLCQGNSTVLDAGAGYSTYHWNNGSTAQTLQVSQTGNFVVTISDTHGCSNQATAQVTVNPVPTVNIAGPFTFCQGISSPITATAGFASYLWTTGASTQAVTVQQSGLYTVTVTDANGCTGFISATVTVKPAPTADISSDLLTICDGSPTTLNVTPGYFYYQWNTGQNTTAISVKHGGAYTVTVTGSNFCTTTATINITAKPAPVPVISGIPAFCPGASTTLDAGAGFVAYLWNNGQTSQAIMAQQAGVYTTTVTNAEGCTGTATVQVTAFPGPVVDLGSPVNLVQGQQTTLNAPVGAGLTYMWSTGATTSSIVVNVAGTYAVTVTNSQGCTGTGNVKVNLVSGTFDPASGRSLSVVPNPAIDRIIVTTQGCSFSSLQLFDNLGRLVGSENGDTPAGEARVFYLDRVPSGIYYLKVRGSDFEQVVRVVKE
jgi:hypothetical protein